MIYALPPLGTRFVLFAADEDPDAEPEYLGVGSLMESEPVGVIYVPKDKSPVGKIREFSRYRLDDGRIFYEYEVEAYPPDLDRWILRRKLEKCGLDPDVVLGKEVSNG